MGKKLNSSSMKISKQEEEKQLNNMINVLRPKVYITDSSSFKKLVQDLTGDHTNVSTTFPNPCNPQMPHHHIESPDPFIEVQDDNGFLESSFGFSLDSGNNSLAKQEMEFSEYKDIESWLLEIDQFQSCDDYGSMAQTEYCDYDISRLI